MQRSRPWLLTSILALASAVAVPACSSASRARSDALAACDASPPARTLTVDAVELAAGREVEGRPELAVMHDGYAYRFASAENRAAFEAAPERFAAADGGACGSMGPLSGLGDARRRTVHEGRIYFFASDGCLATFLKNPARCIETEDPRPRGDATREARGRAALDRVVAWAGGEERLRAVTSYRQTASRTEESGGTVYSVVNVMAAAFPDRYLTRESWNETWFSTVRGPDGAAMASQRGNDAIGAARARAFDRSMARSLVVMLKQYLQDKASGSDPALVAMDAGEGRVGEVEVEFVDAWLWGAATRLAIEKGTGRPVQAAFHGRDATSWVGDSVRTYTAYMTFDGVRLPTAYAVTFNGKDALRSGVTLDGFEINPPLAADLFVVRR